MLHNVTPLVTDNPLDERGDDAFRQRRELLDVAACSTTSSGASRSRLFAATISYGANRGVNPYRYPPLTPNREGVTPLGATINYLTSAVPTCEPSGVVSTRT